MGLLNFLFGSDKTAKKASCKVNSSNVQNLSKVPIHNEEFSQDISADVLNANIVFCSDNGVQFQDTPDLVKIVYDGILAKSGAQEVYAAVGYGDNSQWEDISYYPMQKTAKDTFELLASRKKPGNVNMAFKDGVGNWDNNSGENYSFRM